MALYRLPYLQPHEYVAFMWTGAVAPGQIHCEVVIPSANLPREEDFFQFQVREALVKKKVYQVLP